MVLSGSENGSSCQQIASKSSCIVLVLIHPLDAVAVAGALLPLAAVVVYSAVVELEAEVVGLELEGLLVIAEVVVGPALDSAEQRRLLGLEPELAAVGDAVVVAAAGVDVRLVELVVYYALVVGLVDLEYLPAALRVVASSVEERRLV